MTKHAVNVVNLVISLESAQTVQVVVAIVWVVTVINAVSLVTSLGNVPIGQLGLVVEVDVIGVVSRATLPGSAHQAAQLVGVTKEVVVIGVERMVILLVNVPIATKKV